MHPCAFAATDAALVADLLRDPRADALHQPIDQPIPRGDLRAFVFAGQHFGRGAAPALSDTERRRARLKELVAVEVKRLHPTREVGHGAARIADLLLGAERNREAVNAAVVEVVGERAHPLLPGRVEVLRLGQDQPTLRRAHAIGARSDGLAPRREHRDQRAQLAVAEVLPRCAAVRQVNQARVGNRLRAERLLIPDVPHLARKQVDAPPVHRSAQKRHEAQLALAQRVAVAVVFPVGIGEREAEPRHVIHPRKDLACAVGWPVSLQHAAPLRQERLQAVVEIALFGRFVAVRLGFADAERLQVDAHARDFRAALGVPCSSTRPLLNDFIVPARIAALAGLLPRRHRGVGFVVGYAGRPAGDRDALVVDCHQ